ncbi:MAG: hypothetical protein ABR898_14500, partial [Terracidiphilus sp.]
RCYKRILQGDAVVIHSGKALGTLTTDQCSNFLYCHQRIHAPIIAGNYDVMKPAEFEAELLSNNRQIGNRPTTEKRPVAAGC